MALYASLKDAVSDHLQNLVVIRARIFPDKNVQETLITAVEIQLIAPTPKGRVATLNYRREIGAKHTPNTKVNRYLVKKAEVLSVSIDQFIGSWIHVDPSWWLKHDPVVFCQQEEVGKEYKLLSICHPLILTDLARIDMWIGCLKSFTSSSDLLLSADLEIMHGRLQGFLERQTTQLVQTLSVLVP